MTIDKVRIRHTPFDGSHPPFKINLQPLDLNNWIEVDDNLDIYLAEKQRLMSLHAAETFAAEPETESVQEEVLQLIVQHVERRFPAAYKREGRLLRVNGRPIDLEADTPHLLLAAQLVQEDLLIMRRDQAGWRLVAGSLCFPSSWSLQEKFGQPIEEIHKPVPGFGKGTRNAEMINRIFDKLQVGKPVWRMNWSVYPDDQLFHDARTGDHGIARDIGADAFMRVEYQTLRKLPQTGAILFTVRIHIDPLSLLERHPDRQSVCAGFIGMLEAMDADQLAYKGLVGCRAKLIDRLRAISNVQVSNGQDHDR